MPSASNFPATQRPRAVVHPDGQAVKRAFEARVKQGANPQRMTHSTGRFPYVLTRWRRGMRGWTVTGSRLFFLLGLLIEKRNHFTHRVGSSRPVAPLSSVLWMWYLGRVLSCKPGRETAP